MSFSSTKLSSTMANNPSLQDTLNGQNSLHDALIATTNVTSNDVATTNTTSNEVSENDLQFEPKKRQKTSKVWIEFREVDVEGTKKAECMHCKSKLAILKSRCTTHLSRHLGGCLRRMSFQKKQAKISPQPSGNKFKAQMLTPAFTNGKLDMEKMRESIAHWILMHEHPFTIVEEEGFNTMQQYGMPDWEKISRFTIERDCVQVYEIERKRLMLQLKNIDKISVTTDLWRSTNQKCEHMVLIGHFVDSNWKLQKRVLNFVNIPPPHHGIEIADSFFKCMKEWGIENKIFTISVDNAPNNDSAIRILTDKFSRSNKLLCGGKLFHVRCCAHILNLLVQDGLSKIGSVIADIHESLNFINYNEARLMAFSEVVQELQLPHRKLFLECTTRWSSTFEMLSTAVKFKEVFQRYKEREPRYTCCPSNEDWVKVEKVCAILEVFNATANIITGSEYPTSNLYLIEVYQIKVMLDKIFANENEDDFIHDMVRSMKQKFDKYWGECKLLITVAAILDPRCKMRVVDFCFPKIYSEVELQENIHKVKKVLYETFQEYVTEAQFDHTSQIDDNCGGGINVSNNVQGSCSGWSEFTQFMKSIETNQPQKSELDFYLEEGCYICDGSLTSFDALEWWRVNSSKYRILSKMACDILAIPISTVASEAAFSAGTRVIDSYRASLTADTIQVLICGSDWSRNLYGLKKNNKNEDEEKPLEIMLPIV